MKTQLFGFDFIIFQQSCHQIAWNNASKYQ